MNLKTRSPSLACTLPEPDNPLASNLLCAQMFDDMPVSGPTETHNVRNDGSAFRGNRAFRDIALRRIVAAMCCVAVLNGITPAPLLAQAPPTDEQAGAQSFSVEQIDALLAPIALYPDELLTQILMASAYPLQVVEAARWLDAPANKSLSGDALTAALAKVNWDPSVKSLVPFPQVLAMMNSQLDWMQQLGYAMTVQQNAVMDFVQRLRRQAQVAGQLQTTAQQVVQTEGDTVVIAPASRMWCMCRPIARPWFMARGPIHRIRRSICRHRLVMLSARLSRRGLRSVRALRSPPGCGDGRARTGAAGT